MIDPWIKGGAEKRIREISKRLVERGHEVHCYGIKWWEGEKDIAVDGIYLHGIGNWDNLYVNGRRSIKEGLYFGLKTLTGLKGDFDVIDCQEFPYFSCFSACDIMCEDLYDEKPFFQKESFTKEKLYFLYNKKIRKR